MVTRYGHQRHWQRSRVNYWRNEASPKIVDGRTRMKIHEKWFSLRKERNLKSSCQCVEKMARVEWCVVKIVRKINGPQKSNDRDHRRRNRRQKNTLANCEIAKKKPNGTLFFLQMIVKNIRTQDETTTEFVSPKRIKLISLNKIHHKKASSIKKKMTQWDHINENLAKLPFYTCPHLQEFTAADHFYGWNRWKLCICLYGNWSSF